ncbi:MAG: metallophosphoesterase, partial [Pseudomonadota bacterium]|nr:metallophosphoesterase [Pseudomonadota bacterium]
MNRTRTRRFVSGWAILLLLGSGWLGAAPRAAPARGTAPAWQFVVSGDSRNCGDVVVPSIAAGARVHRAEFYWHLGDLRAVFDFDEDFRAQHPSASIAEYLTATWPDAERNQLDAFGELPVFIAIGNHETTAPKSRQEFIVTFADWLDSAAIRDQRRKDDVHDHAVRTYYHWQRDGVDFITLDNATPDQFDAPQLEWLHALLLRDRHDPDVRAVVVGMHEALPESLARLHSMSESPAAQAAGVDVYAQLLETRKTKPVYVLASHSHFALDNIFDTAFWHDHGGVLPGWIVGTAGAV